MAGINASGLRAWLVQRATGLYVAGFLIAAVLFFQFAPAMGYQDWIRLISHPLINASLVLCLVFLLVHAWVGMRDVVMDYIKPLWLRLTFLLLVVLYLAACCIFGLRILLKVYIA